MARPTDPLSGNQIKQRIKQLQSEESGWTRSLCLGIAAAALKAWQWNHYLENDGDPGPLAGTFPKLPEEPGTWVVVGAEKVTKEGDETLLGMKRENPQTSLWGFGPPPLDTTEAASSRLHLALGETWLVDGQAPECETPDVQQRAMALKLADLLQEKHLLNYLRPRLYREVAEWIGQMLKAPRPESEGLPEPGRTTVWVDPETWQPIGVELPLDGRAVLVSAIPGTVWPGDLWRVPADPLGIPSDEALAHYGTTAEDVAMAAAAWHFGRDLYRKVKDPRPFNDHSGLERSELLRQLLEDLEVVTPRGIPVRSIAEKPVVAMATPEVAALGLRAFPRPDKWDEHEGRGRFLIEKTGRRWELTMATGIGEELAYLSLAQCRKVLKYRNAGVEITALHALLCCYLMQLKDPSARFTKSGVEILKDLGYDTRRTGREGSSRSDLLRELGKWASLLGLAQCEGWSRPGTGETFSMERGPMWSISIHANGQLQLLDQGDPRPETLTDLSLTVTAGTWVDKQLWYKNGESKPIFGPIATEILRLGRYRRELAFRLGIYLTLGFRERRQWGGGTTPPLRVEHLLDGVLPVERLNWAKANRENGRLLRNEWSTALATLRDCVGFRFEFPDCDPSLIPPGFPGHEDTTAPPGALEKLLNSNVVIHWPEKVVEARLREPLADVRARERRTLIRQQQARLLNESRSDAGARLKAARQATGCTVREAAPRLGVHYSKLSKQENGKAPLEAQELQRYLDLLATLGPRGRG